MAATNSCDLTAELEGTELFYELPTGDAQAAADLLVELATRHAQGVPLRLGQGSVPWQEVRKRHTITATTAAPRRPNFFFRRPRLPHHHRPLGRDGKKSRAWDRGEKGLGRLRHFVPGVQIAINTDAHSIGGLDNLPYGIGIGRKGWLRAEDVPNALDTEAIAAWFQS